jgi:CHAT domain-containing protein
LLTDYENELDRLVSDDIQQIGEVHVPTELLRITNLRRIGQVQRALTLSGIRAAAGSAELAALIRKQQDLEQEAEAVSENLAHLRFSPDTTSQTIPARRLDSRLQRLKQASAVLENDIHKRFPKYAELSSPRPIEIAKLSSALLPEQALMIVRIKNDRSYVWVVRSNAQIAFHVVAQGNASLAEKVGVLRDAVDPGTIETLGDIPPFNLSVAHDLYRDFLEPVAQHWRDAGELLVVADSPLNRIPLSMLVTAPHRHAGNEQVLFQSYSQVDWLARSIAVVQLPSVNTLGEISARASVRTLVASKPFAGFGDPLFNDEDDNKPVTRGATLLRGLLPVPPNNPTQTRGVSGLETLPQLPDTRQEILSVAQSLGADPREDVFLGIKANESSVRSAGLHAYRYLSFATHGLLPGDLEGLTETALALSNPTLAGVAGDGLLTSSEIMGLKLDADLAVLSACNTAAADGEGAEAISGLGKAFFYAGARSLLVSNWPVHSESTTALMSVQMIDTMGYVHQGKLAFSYAHPIFWAAFSLIGDGGSR